MSTPPQTPKPTHQYFTDDNNGLHDRLAEYARDAHGAYSPNTIRAINGDMKHFASWCNHNGVSSLPASPEILARYVDEMTPLYASGTIRRRVSSIAHLHRAAELTDPTKSAKAKLALRRMQRTFAARPNQAQGITEHNVSAILATTESRLIDKRDVALLLTARDMLARRSEVIALYVSDITFQEDGVATVMIHKSKTDQEGEGAVMWLSPRTTDAIRQWMRAGGIKEGKLFRSVGRGGRVGGGLSDRDVSRRFKVMAERAGIPSEQISGHSPRVGMTQDLSAAGAELPELMTAGRWKSPQMPARYTERTRASRGAVAKYYDGR